MDIRVCDHTESEVARAIAVGDLDGGLKHLQDALIRRHKELSQRRFDALKVGDVVTFSAETGRGLAGTTATVISKLQKNVKVKADVDGIEYRASPGLLEF